MTSRSMLALSWIAVVAGCGARQAASGRGSGPPVAVCTPHVMGTVGGTLVVRHVCEVDEATLAAWRARGRREAWVARDAYGRRTVGGAGALLGFPGEGRAAERDAAERTAEAVARRLGDGPVVGGAVPGPEAREAAWDILRRSPMYELLRALEALERRGFFGEILAVRRDHADERMEAAFAIHAIAGRDASEVPGGRVSRAADRLARLDHEDQDGARAYLMERSGADPEMQELLGLLAAIEGSAVEWREPVVETAPAMSMVGPIEPLAYAPPGKQAGYLYLGNEAHKLIGAYYKLANSGDTVMLNYFPIASILDKLRKHGHKPSPGGLTARDLGSMPDIVNLTQLHIYEIKPAHSQAAGAIKARLYVGRFARGGIMMSLGPPGAPGTSGTIPAPGGAYVFWSPEPGVIVYEYRSIRPPIVLAPAPQEATQPHTAPARSPRSSRSFQPQPQPIQVQLEPSSARDRSLLLTVGGTLLLVAAFMLVPKGI